MAVGVDQALVAQLGAELVEVAVHVADDVERADRLAGGGGRVRVVGLAGVGERGAELDGRRVVALRSGAGVAAVRGGGVVRQGGLVTGLLVGAVLGVHGVALFGAGDRPVLFEVPGAAVAAVGLGLVAGRGVPAVGVRFVIGAVRQHVEVRLVAWA